MDAYIFQAALLCEGCADETMTRLESRKVENNGDSDTFPQGPYANGGGEADSPSHCDHCGLFLENPLTSDGYAYVEQAVAERDPTERALAQTVWAPFYGIEVNDDIEH